MKIIRKKTEVLPICPTIVIVLSDFKMVIFKVVFAVNRKGSIAGQFEPNYY